MPTPSKPPTARLPKSAPQGEISPEELRTFMDGPGPREFRLVDVREEDEFQICRLEWAELIPLAQIPEQAPHRLVDKDRPIVVYCHHGMRSQHACEWLRRAGYEHVFNLTGGIDAWADRIEPSMRRY
jgi:rhodanese-related sulfurtransferase